MSAAAEQPAATGRPDPAGAVRHPRFAPRRTRPGGTWWSRAVLRAVEEAAYSEADLRAGRAIARSGGVGGITVSRGSAVAAVEHDGDLHTVTVTMPVLHDAAADTLVELVASGSGHVGALMTGDLPHALVESIEEAGVELLPYGGELGSECTCEGWLDPCPHALAVLTQVAWLVQADPFVLTHLRGLPREDVLARLHALTAGAAQASDEEDELGDDLLVAEAAVLKAAALLQELEEG
jgi:uncharacterized Zn finger protein